MGAGLEQVGVALLITALVLLPPQVYGLWRGYLTFELSVISLTVGLTLGVTYAIRHRPTQLSAAIEADKLLGLSELLSTASALRFQRDIAASDAWPANFLLLADSHCQKLSAHFSSVTFRQWGRRAWGGLGLIMALVFTLALLSVNHQPTIPNEQTNQYLIDQSFVRRLNGPALSPIGLAMASVSHAGRFRHPSGASDETSTGASAMTGQNEKSRLTESDVNDSRSASPSPPYPTAHQQHRENLQPTEPLQIKRV